MKVLYGIQGTGNGHIARAKELIPELSKKAEVDVLISGAHHDLTIPVDVKYNFKGMGFYFGKNGGIDYWKSWKQFDIRKFISEINTIDIKLYDLVITDFEPISAWAAKKHKVPSVSLSHQSAMLSPFSPKPKSKDLAGELILHYYAPSKSNIAFHFNKYDNFIYTPIIRREVRTAKINNNGHYTVYLPAYSDSRIIEVLSEFGNTQWEVFSKHTKSDYEVRNIKIKMIDGDAFCESMANSEGVICGAGFETPAEAMFMNKKLLVVPMAGQYEQKCNGAALKTLGVPVLKDFCTNQHKVINEWITSPKAYSNVNYPDNVKNVALKVLACE